ncbi:sugar ABC transporter substrate-binding protein [Nocardioides baekrokdamisoli]|uniref:Sugar ABC transporter substrate-binding protein n=1 Tax=Nocardioides baekrokdamisoli TaxID=1804624 RepID=A0A3G9J378_9ACTN|nr:substrate-binding domain-containing protein [Nocardioides baekrokdamisoli]BBH17459.1 sugar ABC transporter substrate-binding protein [Nocardioides baekrokdamisoli]
MKKFTALVGLVASAATLAACGSTSGPSGSGSTGSHGGGATIGLVMLQSDDYFQSIQKTVEAQASAAGDSVIAVTSNGDAGTEASNVQTLIQRGVKAIIMQPVDPTAGSVATMKSIAAAGIPLICYGNCTGDAASNVVVKGVVQSDNTALGTGTGKVAADYIKAKLGGKATIAILNCDVAAVCKLRKAGFKAALAAAGVQADYVSDQSGFLVDKATPVATNILAGNPNINLVWSANEGGTEGWVASEVNSGKQIPVFGTDISKQLAQEVLASNNLLQATTGQDSVGTATKAFEMASNAVAGTANTPFEVDLPGITYTRADPAPVNKYLGK